MTRSVNVHEAKTHLSALLARVEQGEELVIARAGVPIGRLVPLERGSRLGLLAGALSIPDDFDAPLEEEELATWE